MLAVVLVLKFMPYKAATAEDEDESHEDISAPSPAVSGVSRIDVEGENHEAVPAIRVAAPGGAAT